MNVGTKVKVRPYGGVFDGETGVVEKSPYTDGDGDWDNLVRLDGWREPHPFDDCELKVITDE